MGSQTLEILRQGVWASLTGGWFYDPHQGVFCNVVHLYLWLFLLCAPFVAYLYFPGTWLTWCVYCVLTSVTILLVKLVNMALHRLYDRAQSMSEANLKNQFFKITKETAVREDETGIEMKILGADGSRNSVEQAINEASEENSMMSMENVNSIIDLKVDVHRKNSSESIELMFYAPSMMSNSSQQDHQSITGATSINKSIRSSDAAHTKYLTVYPEHELLELPHSSGGAATSTSAGGKNSASASVNAAAAGTSLPPPSHLMRKSSEDYKHRHQQRRRLERQSSLDAAAESAIVSKLMRQQSETLALAASTTAAAAGRNETFLHPQQQQTNASAFNKSAASTSSSAATSSAAGSSLQQRLNTTTNATNSSSGSAVNANATASSGTGLARGSRLQRHRSSETHDERLKHQQRSLFLPIHHEHLHHHHHHHHNPHHNHHHVASGASSSGALAALDDGSRSCCLDADEMELGLGGSASGVAGHGSGAEGGGGGRVRTLQSWILGSSSDVYIEDDSYTKSDFGIEQLDGRTTSNSSRAAYLLQQQQQLNSHYQHQQQFRAQHHRYHQHHHHHHHGSGSSSGGGANIRKDSNSTMSALQLPIVTSASGGCGAQSKTSGGGGSGGIKRRRHSNATALFKSSTAAANAAANAAAAAAAAGQVGPGGATVRRIKSAALEIGCPHPSVSNLCPHPNSVEAISGQQQIKNPQSALLPPPSKCLVRNPHLNLCPKFGGSFGGGSSTTTGSGSSLNFGAASASGSTQALIEPPVYPIVEQSEKKTCSDDLEVADLDADMAAATRTCVGDPASADHSNDDCDDGDDDDEIDDVPPSRRQRHKALGLSSAGAAMRCRAPAPPPDAHSAESDVGDILDDEPDDGEEEEDVDDDEDDDGDDYEFKDFDYNLEHILNDLQHTHNQLDDLKATYAAAEQQQQQQQHQQTQLQLACCTQHSTDCEGATSTSKQANENDEVEEDDDDDDDEETTPSNAAGGATALRQRSHSTDSETDNNGSRSPLLSGKQRASSSEAPTSSSAAAAARAAAAAADKAMRNEIMAVQKQKQQYKQVTVSANLPQHLYEARGGAGGGSHNKGEADSGCPSSDCEQISASSKDQLLAGIEHADNCTPLPGACLQPLTTTPTTLSLPEDVKSGAKDLEEGGGCMSNTYRSREQSSQQAPTKSLGAIPKVVKYREIDETQREMSASSGIGATTTTTSQLHKRRGDRSTLSAGGVSGASNTKAPSRTSSSNSSRSISADSFSADIHKMLWLMHGGAVDERGRPIAGIGPDGAPIAASHNVVPPNMSSAHFQFYQDAIQALNTYPANGVAGASSASAAANVGGSDGLSVAERIYFRDKIRRSSKQHSEPSSIGGADYSASSHLAALPADLPLSAQSSTSGRPAPIGVVVASNAAAALNARNVSSNAAATLSIQGLISVMNDKLDEALSQTRLGVGGASGAPNATVMGSGVVGGGGLGTNNGSVPSTAAILNVDGHHMENYCDYWRPACMLSAEKPIVPKSYYKYRFKCCGYEQEFKISMDRLELLALFDRDLHWLHILLAVMLSTLVAYLGATILQQGYYKDFFAFVFCAVIAGSQYSLVKSVQPDAASPIHGFNKTVAYSRAIYFSLCGGLLLLLEQMKRDYDAAGGSTPDLHFFGVSYSPAELTIVLLHIMYMVLLAFPLIFSLGLFPQVNTFLMYALEQFDMHVFGGNAAGSLLGSFLCVLRSIIGIMLLYGPLYAALAEGRGTQYIVFSIFCAMLIPLGYHLSRSASDFSHIWALVKNCIVSTYRDDDDELSAPSASPVEDGSQQKITTSTPKRSKHGRTANAVERISNENIEMSSLEKITTTTTTNVERGGGIDDEHTNLERKSSKSKASSLGSSSQTLGKIITSSKKAMTASNSYASVSGGAGGGAEGGIDNANENDRLDGKTCRDINGVIAENIKDNVQDEDDGNDDADEDDDDDDDEPNVNDKRNVPAAEHDDKMSSSSTTNPGDISTLTAGGVAGDIGVHSSGIVGEANGNSELDTESPDPLPKKLQNTVNTRLKNDLVVTSLLALIVLGLHSSTVFTVLQPDLNIVLYAFTGALGLLLHYVIPQMRKHMPWLCFARPILRQKEYGQFEVSHAPKVMWFEKVYIYLCMIERNVLFPLLVISALTADSQLIAQKFGIGWGTLIVAVCALKFIRNAYSDPANQYLIVMFTVLFFRIDFAMASETFLIDYFFVSLAFRKCCDFLLKLQFIVTYIAPWQITWGSAFHAFAQPFSVPHSAMLFLQAAVSAILSTPLNPFLGSAIFLTSYVRPIKFWERDYNTRRIDHSNTRLSSQLERDLGADDNNLNSIFYEHLTRSLQHSLCGDLLMGRWGNVNQGDCFVLASDYLNCLVHIIELGNGLCTFQMRGLEFRGTYCQQREVEAITEDVEDNDGCCCYDAGHLPRMLSVNAMFSTRWLAWQVEAAQYVLEGYSISDNLASATLQVFEYRKVLITYYIKSIIYYVIKNPKLEQWLASGPIQDALQHTLSRQFVDLDPIFNYNLDEDFDFRAMGITRSSFCYIYLSWINYCYDKRKEQQNPNATATATAQTTTPAQAQTQQPTAPPPASTSAYNDSKSTPNLSTTNTPQAKSQSQQQLRTTNNNNSSSIISSSGNNNNTSTSRPQKSATMSGSATEHIATSQSFANISRQTSESAPGLTGAGLTLGYASNSTAATSALHHHTSPLDNSRANSALTVGLGPTTSKLSALGRQTSHRATKSLRSRQTESPNQTTMTTTASASASASETVAGNGGAEKPTIKLKVPSIAKDSPIVSLCLALGLLARRSLATASHSSLTGVEFFLHGLHALFKGDFRITSPRDEWVFADMELLHSVVAPAVKMALKLQQDHISNPDEFLYPLALYEAIDTCSKDLVISHEADPVWRSAVLRGAPNLLALRHVMEDGSDEYRIIRLTKRFLSFRVIKLNRECVRGLWAGQQQELIYLRNRNPERGSIQNAKQALRNIINSSCDQPIGYPIYVSPLTTSYADTNEQLREIDGGAITLESIKSNVLDWWTRIRERCRQGCSSGSALETSNLGVITVGGGPACAAGGDSGEIAPVYISAPLYNTLTVGNFFGLRSAGNAPSSIGGSLSAQYGSDGLAAIRSGLAVMPVKPSSTTLIAGLLNREREQEREREVMRGSVGIRKSQTQSTGSSSGCGGGGAGSRNDRERRATLPIASTSLGVVSGAGGGVGGVSGSGSSALSKYCVGSGAGVDAAKDSSDMHASSSPRYKISCSSASLGIGNIITTPGDYPRKSKGPLCLTTATTGAVNEGGKAKDLTLLAPYKPRIELYKKAIIVDDTEIYDCLDLGRLIDVTWPNDEMRLNGGRLSWKDWMPRAGMVGYVVHYWIPNHADQRCRSHVNRIVYLLEIGEHYVPVGEVGLREYNQIMDASSEKMSRAATQRRGSLQQELEELRHQQQQQYHQQQQQQRQREGLTPILGSSLESPVSQLASTSGNGFNGNNSLSGCGSGAGAKSKIKAVSSSSSEDEVGLINFEMQRREILLNMWKLITDNSRGQSPETQEEFDYGGSQDEGKVDSDEKTETSAVHKTEVVQRAERAQSVEVTQRVEGVHRVERAQSAENTQRAERSLRVEGAKRADGVLQRPDLVHKIEEAQRAVDELINVDDKNVQEMLPTSFKSQQQQQTAFIDAAIEIVENLQEEALVQMPITDEAAVSNIKLAEDDVSTQSQNNDTKPTTATTTITITPTRTTTTSTKPSDSSEV